MRSHLAKKSQHIKRLENGFHFFNNSYYLSHQRFIILLLFLILSAAVKLSAQQKCLKHEIFFKTDNDVYLGLGLDRYYTQGFLLGLTKAINTHSKKNWIKKTASFSIGQEIYTPYVAYSEVKEDVDRPFAGYLYVSSALNWFTKAEEVFSAEVQVGIIGPHALGEEVQAGWHKTFGFYEVRGWQFQLNNAFQVNLNAGYKKTFFRNRQGNFDFIGNGIIRAGTRQTSGEVAGLLRLGRLNPISTSAVSAARVDTRQSPIPKELYLYVRPYLSVVAYDATIEGGLFVQQHGEAVSGKINAVIAGGTMGFVYASRRWMLTFSATCTTKDTKGMYYFPVWGSASLGFRF